MHAPTGRKSRVSVIAVLTRVFVVSKCKEIFLVATAKDKKSTKSAYKANQATKKYIQC